MDVSKFLAKSLGLYLTIVSIIMLINASEFLNLLNALIHNELLLFVTGFFTLIIGVLIVSGHNIWRWEYSLAITIIGWLTLIKGIILIAYPNFITQKSLGALQPSSQFYIGVVVNLLIGLLLCYFGFKRRRV